MRIEEVVFEAPRAAPLEELVIEACSARFSGFTISSGWIRKLILSGSILVGGARAKDAKKEVASGTRIKVYVEIDHLKRQDEPYLSVEDILFEDDALIVINKPVGLPTQPTVDPSRRNCFQELKRVLRERDGAEPYIGLHHRLDRDTSGVILFTKDTRANSGVADLFAKRQIKKIYRAIAVGEWKGKREVEIKNYLRRESKSKRARMIETQSGGDPAETRLAVLSSASGLLQVEARPLTGRMHQVRVHLSGIGLPILGDALYGGPCEFKQIPVKRIYLHAFSLMFLHPLTSREHTIESPLPQDFLDCLDAAGFTI